MIRKITSERLKPGMYVHELGGSWFEHPFWRNRFLIADDADVQRILDAGIGEVYIDTVRGLDDAEAVDVHLVAEQLMEEMAAAAAEPLHDWQPVAVEEEYARAREVHSQAQKAVHAVLHDVRLGRAIATGALESVIEAITDSIMRCPSALIGLVGLKSKDDYTFLHCVSVGTLMIAFGRTLGLPVSALRELGMGGLLHDVGKMRVPDAILNKPGALSEEEFAVIKRHPEDGHRVLLEHGGIAAAALDITRHHHERIDGSGYPDGLAGSAISHHARMSAVVDVYDAITADRCYHHGMPATEALRKMWEWSENHFDRGVLQAFMKCVGIYPVGSVVKLQSGLIGVVVEQNAQSLLNPRVKLLYHSTSMRFVKPSVIDLENSDERIVSCEPGGRWPIEPALHIGATH